MFYLFIIKTDFGFVRLSRIRAKQKSKCKTAKGVQTTGSFFAHNTVMLVRSFVIQLHKTSLFCAQKKLFFSSLQLLSCTKRHEKKNFSRANSGRAKQSVIKQNVLFYLLFSPELHKIYVLWPLDE